MSGLFSRCLSLMRDNDVDAGHDHDHAEEDVRGHGLAEAEDAADDTDNRRGQHGDRCLADLDVLQYPAPEEERECRSQDAVVDQAEDGIGVPDDLALRHDSRVGEQGERGADHLPRRQGDGVDVRELELDDDAREAPEDGAQEADEDGRDIAARMHIHEDSHASDGQHDASALAPGQSLSEQEMRHDCRKDRHAVVEHRDHARSERQHTRLCRDVVEPHLQDARQEDPRPVLLLRQGQPQPAPDRQQHERAKQEPVRHKRGRREKRVCRLHHHPVHAPDQVDQAKSLHQRNRLHKMNPHISYAK